MNSRLMFDAGLWMQAGSLENTREAKELLVASRVTFAFCVISNFTYRP